ncbi:MAG: YbaB/EbfC family nucleoid-associated protein [Armatimonadetes bacterium]|nr:YbaB/EbfC family nucleoid-associated protein [Armatimonadota bacterium]
MMGNLGNLMKQLQQAQQRAEELRGQLASERFQVDAGGGLVRIIASGLGEVLEVHVDGEKLGLAADELELLQDALVAALQRVSEQAQENSKEMLRDLTGDIPLPPGMGI